MENIIHIDELADVVDRALTEINRGIATARKKGIFADLPKEVQIDAVLVSRFEVLELPAAAVVESIEEKGDVSREVGSENATDEKLSQSSGKTLRTSEETTKQDNAYNAQTNRILEHE